MRVSPSSGYKNLFSLTFVILFSLGNLTWKSNIFSGTLTNINRGLDYFTFSFHVIGKSLNDVFNSYRSYQSLKTETDLLREKLKQTQSLNWQITELKSENKRLRQVLNLRPKYSYEIVQAEVISNKPDDWFQTIVIDKGENHGIKPYMPVIANQIASTQFGNSPKKYEKIVEGLVGKTIQVNPNYSRILLITNQYSKLGVIIKKTGYWALLEGQGSVSQFPLLKFVNLNINIKKDDEIITSGNQGIFPKGIPVGKISGKIKRVSGFQGSEITPFLNFEKLDYVFVIKKERDKSQQKLGEPNFK